MKKSLLKKLMAITAGAAMVLASALPAMGAGTAPTSVKTLTDKCKISIHLYDSDIAGDIGTGEEITDTTTGLPQGAAPLSGKTLKFGQVGEVVQYTTKDGQQTGIRYKIINDTFKTLMGIEATTTGVEEDGGNFYITPDGMQDLLSQKISGTDMMGFINQLKSVAVTDTPATNAQGLTEVSNANGLYIFIGGNMGSDVTSLITPFLVSAPMPKTDNGSVMGWNTGIHVYPKVSTNPVKLTKTAAQGNETGENITVNTYDPITYTVKAEFPANDSADSTHADFSKIMIEDTLPDGMEAITGGNSSAVLNVKDEKGAVTSSEKLSMANKDFTIGLSQDKKTVTIAFTPEGLKKVNQNPKAAKEVVVTYQTRLGEGAVLGTHANPNKAKVTFNRFDNTEDATAQDTSDVHTYGIDLTKTLSDGAAIEANDTITFEVKDHVGTLLKFKKGADGSFWHNQGGTEADTTTSLVVPVGGKLGIYGLKPGIYTITETKTKAGYSLLAKPIQVEIKKTTNLATEMAATIDGVEAKFNRGTGTFLLTVVNTAQTTGFTLPKTGGAGTLLAIAAGFGLIFISIVLLGVYRSKNSKGQN